MSKIFKFGNNNSDKRDEVSTITIASVRTPLTSSNKVGSTSMNIASSTAPRKSKFAFRQDSVGYNPDKHHSSDVKIASLTYNEDESEAYRAHNASTHYKYRGTYWNEGKREIMIRYIQLALIGLIQGSIAYFCNVACHYFVEVSSL